MNMKIVGVVIIAVIVLAAVVFVGSNALQGDVDNQSGPKTGVKDTFSVDENGGSFSILQDNVEMNIFDGSVSEQVDITVESVVNPVEDSSLYMFSCYDFGPDGLTFEKPVDLIIHYDVNGLPDGVEESEIKIYVLTNDSWEPIEGSFVNQAMHYAVAKVSHFSMMGGAARAPSSSTSDGPADGGDSEDDGSSQYWFKATPHFYSYQDPRLVDWNTKDSYHVGYSWHWEPVPYVQYYEIKFEFNGNTPEDYAWGHDYREQSKSYVHPGPYPFKEGYIYHIGGDPSIDGFISVIKTGEATATKLDEDTGEMETILVANLWPMGNHGYNFVGVHTDIDDQEELSGVQKGAIVSQMETFVKAYVEGWDVWVRGVTETQ